MVGQFMAWSKGRYSGSALSNDVTFSKIFENLFKYSATGDGRNGSHFPSVCNRAHVSQFSLLIYEIHTLLVLFRNCYTCLGLWNDSVSLPNKILKKTFNTFVQIWVCMIFCQHFCFCCFGEKNWTEPYSHFTKAYALAPKTWLRVASTSEATSMTVWIGAFSRDFGSKIGKYSFSLLLRGSLTF